MLAQPATSSSEQADGTRGEPPLISVVVPVYKEERNIRPFLERTVPVLERLGHLRDHFLPRSLAGSDRERDPRRDRANPSIGLLVFSRRFGQPAATMAGILNCRGRWCVVIDVDLQDPPEVIETIGARRTKVSTS